MTAYYSVHEITPQALQWARTEAALREQELTAVQSGHDLRAYKRRRGLRRRAAGYGREMTRRLMAIVYDEEMGITA